jgi:tetratricopeptide (TPR) repeat protein
LTTRHTIGFALIVCLTGWAFSTGASSADPKQFTASDFLAQGREALNSNKPDEAIHAFDSAIALDSTNAVVFYNRAAARRQKRDIDGALADYDTAISIDPAYANAYRARGNIFHLKGEKGRAISDYNRAIELKPNDAPTYFLRAILWVNEKDHIKAYQDFDRAIMENPKYAEAYIRRGRLYHDDGKLELALADYDAAIAAEPANEDAYTRRGEVVLQMRKPGENFDRVIANFEQAVKTNPNSRMAKEQLQVGLALQQMFEYAKAERQNKAQQQK